MDGQYLPDDEIDIDSLSSPEPPEYVPQMFAGGGDVAPPDTEEDFFQNLEMTPALSEGIAKQKLALWAEKNQPEMLTANNNELAVVLMGMRRDLLTGDDRNPRDQGWIREDNPRVAGDYYQTLPTEENVFELRRQMPRPESFDYPRLKKGYDTRENEKQYQDDIFEGERDWEEQLGLPYSGPYHRGGPYSQGGEVKERDIEYYARGGEASYDQSVEAMNKYLLADEEDTMPVAYATTPYGATQPTAPEMSRQTAKLMLKRLSTKSGGGKSKRSKEMSMPMGDLSPAIPELGAPQTEHEKLVQFATARSQYDALEKAYKLKAQAAQRAGKGLMKPTFNTVMFDQPTLEKPGPLMARTFAKGGEADALEGMQNKARENEMYRASEKYLNSRGQMPDIKISRFLPDEVNAEFNSVRLPLGSGTIKVNKDVIASDFKKDIGPALLAHEITHAADRQMKQQAIEQRGKGTKFAEAYEKLVGSEGRNRLEPAKRADYEWAEGNRFYRSTPEEIAAHGVGAFSGPMLQDRAPLHVDPTAATEFQILLDLAQRDVNNGPKGLAQVPAFLKKFFKYADGGPVYRADGSPPSGERLTPQQIEQLASDQAELNRYQPVMNTNIQRQGAKSRQLASERDVSTLPDPQTYAFIESALFGTPPDEVANEFGVFHPKRKEILGRAEQGFVTGNAALIGPAARMLKEVGTPVVKYLGKEAARQVERGIFNEGPLRGITPQPLYISRPPGGYFPTSRGMGERTAEEINNTKLSDLPEGFVSWLNTDDKQKGSFLGLGPKKESLGDKYGRWKTETGNRDYSFGVLSGVDSSLQPVLKKITELEPGEKRDALFQMFNQKAKDFYSKQAGSIQDPLRADILSGKFKFDDKSALGDVFPQVLVKQAAQGNIQALRLLEKNYDDMIDIRATVPYRQDQPAPAANTLKSQIIESVRDNLDTIPDAQLLAYAGKKPLPGPDGVAKAATEVRLKLKENPNLFSTVLEPNIERTVFARQSTTSDLNLAQYPNAGTTATKAMVNPQGPALTKEQLDKMETLPRGYYLPEMEAAIDKNQPILDSNLYGNLKLLGLNADKLLQEANKISAKDLNSMGFTDFLKKAYTSTQEVAQIEKDLTKVKSLLQQGKNPPAKAMLFGVTDFLPTVNDMRWVKVTNPDGVKSIAAGMNNSVGSYATSEVYGALGRGRRALDSGEVEVYALYDKNHVPHVTVEYGTGKLSVPEKQRSQILALTGNGPLTANELSTNYAEQIADLVNKLPIKNVTALPASTQKILKNNFFEFKDNRVVRNEEEFTKNQEIRKELGLAKGGLVDKNTAFIKAHT